MVCSPVVDAAVAPDADTDPAAEDDALPQPASIPAAIAHARTDAITFFMSFLSFANPKVVSGCCFHPFVTNIIPPVQSEENRGNPNKLLGFSWISFFFLNKIIIFLYTFKFYTFLPRLIEKNLKIGYDNIEYK